MDAMGSCWIQCPSATSTALGTRSTPCRPQNLLLLVGVAFGPPPLIPTYPAENALSSTFASLILLYLPSTRLLPLLGKR